MILIQRHRVTTFQTTLIIKAVPLLLLIAPCLGFSHPPSLFIMATRQRRHYHQQSNNHSNIVHGGNIIRDNQLYPHPTAVTASADKILCKMNKSSSSTLDDDKNSDNEETILQRILFKCNSSTKWIVTLLNTVLVWSQPHRYEGPFIVFGSIMAVYFTNFLKSIINQSRPDGAPFADPGMPSSHSLTCYFIVSAWNSSPIITSPFIKEFLRIGAATVACLRVVCGYHSWAQVGVGAVLGSLLGSIWVTCGHYWYSTAPLLLFKTAWGLYLCASALFICTKMKDWTRNEKDL